MKRAFVRRLLGYGLTFFLAITLNFLLPRLMPGDPLQLIAGDSVRQLGAERIAELRAQYGFDRPLSEQYLRYLGQLSRGDLGNSYRFSGGRSVGDILLERFRWTLLLVGVSLGLAFMVGSALGVWAVWRRSRARDLGLLAAMFTLRSIPPFWLALLLVPIFAIRLDLFPAGDTFSIPRPGGWAGVWDVLHHAALPVLALTLSYIPTAFAVMRASMLGVLGQEYLRAAWAKGLPERVLVLRHAVRNALPPVVTSLALDVGQLLGGVTLIETVFNYRGLGNMMFEAVKSRDYPLLQGGFLLFTVGVILINLITDGLYPVLDPRLRGEAR